MCIEKLDLHNPIRFCGVFFSPPWMVYKDYWSNAGKFMLKKILFFSNNVDSYWIWMLHLKLIL